MERIRVWLDGRTWGVVLVLFGLVLGLSVPGVMARRPADRLRLLYLNGFGPVRIGMTVNQASNALGIPLKPMTPHEAGCYYVSPGGQPDSDVAFMVIQDRVARVDVFGPTFQTVTGIHVGDTEERVKAAYQGYLKIEPHHYVNHGHYLIVTPKAATYKGMRIVFETDGQVVTMIRAGREPEVMYVEGCL